MRQQVRVLDRRSPDAQLEPDDCGSVRHPPGQRRPGGPHRQQGAEQWFPGSGLRQEVAGRGVLQRARPERHRGQRQCHPGRRRPDQPASGAGPQQHQRPEQVELLLDRQRPGVVEPGRQVPGRPQPQVAGVRQAHQGGPGEPEPDVAEHVAPGGKGQEQHDEGRVEPARPAQVEPAQVDPAGPSFAQQQSGDEIAGQHEEDVDAHPAAAEPRHTEVVEHHGQARDGAQPVEARLTGPVGCRPPAGRGAHTCPSTAPRRP